MDVQPRSAMKTKDYRAGLLKRLKYPDYAAGYLSDVLREESDEAFLIALRDVLNARDPKIATISKRSGVTRQGSTWLSPSQATCVFQR